MVFRFFVINVTEKAGVNVNSNVYHSKEEILLKQCTTGKLSKFCTLGTKEKSFGFYAMIQFLSSVVWRKQALPIWFGITN